MNKTELAWAAGIMDGEGTILISRGVFTNRRKTPGFQLRISLNMTHRVTVEKFASLFNLKVKKHKARKVKHNPTWMIVTSDIKAENVVRHLKPYLVTKLAQATLGLHFRETTKQPIGAQETPKNLVVLRKRYYKLMKDLNRRGR